MRFRLIAFFLGLPGAALAQVQSTPSKPEVVQYHATIDVVKYVYGVASPVARLRPGNILEANSLGNLVSEDNFEEMKSFLQKVGLNRVFEGKTLTVNFIKPWDSLAQTVESSFADNEFTLTSDKWWR